MKRWVPLLLVLVLVASSVAVGASTIRLAMGAEPRNLLPANTQGTWESAIAGLVWDGLATGNNQMKPVPSMAESWEFNEASLTWSFKLREGLLWHDGTEITADDVVFSFYSRIHPDYPGVRFGSTYSSILNAEAFHNGEIDDFSQVGVRAVGKYYVEIQLESLQATFLIYTATAGIIPKHIYEPYFEENGYAAQAGATLDLGYLVGSGPYKFVEWVADQYVKLEKYDDFWNPRDNPIVTDGQPTVAGIDEVYFVIIPDSDAQFLALQAGEIDGMATTVDQYFAAVDDDALDAFQYPRIVYDYLCFQLNPEVTPLFQDVKVRRAIAYALDREKMIDEVLLGLGSVCNGPSHPLRWDWEDEFNDLHPDYNVEETIRLMEEAGWTIEKNEDGSIPRGAFWTKDGEIFEFEIATNFPNPRRNDFIQIMQQQLFNAGFSITLRILDTNAFYYDYLMGSYKFEAAVAGWKIGTDPDVTSVWTTGAYPDAFNWLPYSNEKIDELAEQGLQKVLIEDRKPIYSEIARILIEDQPYVWLAFQAETFASRTAIGLKNFEPTNPNGWYVNLWQWDMDG